MALPHPKYKIKEGDTIQTITALFAFDQDKWLRYHNNMCRLDNIIRDKIPEHLEEIYLSPELWDKELILNRPRPSVNVEKSKPNFIVLGYQNTLYLKSITGIQNYGVKITIQNNTKVQSIRYKIQTKWLGKTDDDSLVEINYPESVYINDIEPDLKVDQLAIDVYKALYPIVFKINSNGNIIDITNFEEIKERWQNGLSEIKKYRFGESLDKYIRLCSYSLTSEKTLLQKLKQDYFLFTYFLGIHQTYEDECQIDHEINFPLSQQPEKVLFKVSSTIYKQIDLHDRVKVMIKGESSQESSSPDSTYYAKYYIDPKTHLIDASITKVNIEPNKEITIKISNIT